MRNQGHGESHPIVVAVDGSPESANALRWAARRAKETGTGLRIITCYEQHYVGGEGVGVTWSTFETTKRAREERASQVIESVLGPGDVDHIVALGPIDRVLIDYSAAASMIVIGTRESSGIRGRFRSSVTDRVTGMVDCPVMSVPLGAAVADDATDAPVTV